MLLIDRPAARQRFFFPAHRCVRRFLAGALLSLGHRQVNAPALAVASLVEPRDDLFHCPRHRFYVSLLVTANRIVSLHDDVTMPAGADHIPGRVGRLHRDDCIVFFVQSGRLDKWSGQRPLYAQYKHKPISMAAQQRKYERCTQESCATHLFLCRVALYSAESVSALSLCTPFRSSRRSLFRCSSSCFSSVIATLPAKRPLDRGFHYVV